MGKAEFISKSADLQHIPTEPDAFLQWCARHGEEGVRYELSRGRVSRMMINVTKLHARLCTNLILALGAKLDTDKFDLSTADFGVRTPVGVRYPDVLAEPFGADGKALASDNPIVIAEVLSPSTTSLDFGDKAREYEQIASLKHYLLCDQDRPTAWLFTRGEEGEWNRQAELIEGLGQTVALPGLDIELAMKDIYRGVADANKES